MGTDPTSPLSATLPAKGTRPGTAAELLVVGMGASAGGLEACKKLLQALPADTGMAFILVQHLDPTHESMMVELLADHTSMTVRQAADGMPLEPEHLYVIPPGSYLSVAHGALRLTYPRARHGARMPFDHLLYSLAEECGERAICLVLSGTGADGSLGLQSIKKNGGLVIVQDPDEAAYDGMPRNAIMTGLVDHVLPVARIAEALSRPNLVRSRGDRAIQPAALGDDASIASIIELLRSKTAHDFTQYKPGTLRRRIERRMGMAAIDPADKEKYLELLRQDQAELDLLAKDLLINVTSFFRDRKVFDFLAEKIVPDLVANRPPDQPIRIWDAGCSTGEETYSLAMLFLEQIASAKRNIKLQVFASDVDGDAVTSAREGLYPDTIASDVSPERLARFFVKEDGRGYRVVPELRSCVVFTVQDILADPPFSRLDMISCRNLLIYLLPEAQAKVISLFHFALREGGVLLLGKSESVGTDRGLFEPISKSAKVYRHVGRRRHGELLLSLMAGRNAGVLAQLGPHATPMRQIDLGELSRRLVAENFGPAAVLINNKHECLYSLGPTDLYLHVVPGRPTQDLLAMARAGVRTKLRSAIHRASEGLERIVVPGGRLGQNGQTLAFSIAVQPVLADGERLLLVCFIEEARQEPSRPGRIAPEEVSRVAELEEELEATRVELEGAIHNLEVASEDQKAVNEEALSVNEEFQSTNEELLTSKEELQSLNEELTALNSQLQETLERQRTSANDLQNILYSTDVATIFLDLDLHIRFFTPAVRSLFKLIPSDIGRPLGDLSLAAGDTSLLADAGLVLQTLSPIEKEFMGENGAWYVRRIMPYRTQDSRTEGVVITFVDITERHVTAERLEQAKEQALSANAAKSRFLAAASHDLRQPLQTMALLQGILAKTVTDARARQLVARLDETLAAMSGMLNVLLDINQIESGTIRADRVIFPVNEMLERLRAEFAYHAEAQGTTFRTIPCHLSVQSDPRLLEQMVRNLLSNALKFTRRGKVLLGCRRRADVLSIEVWDNGIGIPKEEQKAIFEEYHQVGNVARERTHGLGLGLAIVQRLGNLLGHRVRVRSDHGKGSCFAIEIALAPDEPGTGETIVRPDAGKTSGPAAARSGQILIVEDDPEIREFLSMLLESEGHRVATAADGPAALELVARGTIRPELVIADFNLPNDLNGLQIAARLRDNGNRELPVIVLTGDISTGTLRAIADANCVRLDKPVRATELAETIQQLLTTSLPPRPPRAERAIETRAGADRPVIYVVDDDSHVRDALRAALELEGHAVEDFANCEEFLAAFRPGRACCLVVDAYLPGMSGVDLLRHLRKSGQSVPSIVITGGGDIALAVEAMKAGATDFIVKPVAAEDLLAGVEQALEHAQDSSKLSAMRAEAAKYVATLTPRQRQILEMVLAGQPSKNIAVDLGISQRTVENHRASIMRRTKTKSLPALVRLILTAEPGAGEPRN